MQREDILSDMQVARPIHSIVDAGNDVADAGIHGQNVLKLQSKYAFPTMEHAMLICLIGPKPEQKNVLLTIEQLSTGVQLIVGTHSLVVTIYNYSTDAGEIQVV